MAARLSIELALLTRDAINECFLDLRTHSGVGRHGTHGISPKIDVDSIAACSLGKSDCHEGTAAIPHNRGRSRHLLFSLEPLRNRPQEQSHFTFASCPGKNSEGLNKLVIRHAGINLTRRLDFVDCNRLFTKAKRLSG